MVVIRIEEENIISPVECSIATKMEMEKDVIMNDLLLLQKKKKADVDVDPSKKKRKASSKEDVNGPKNDLLSMQKKKFDSAAAKPEKTPGEKVNLKLLEEEMVLLEEVDVGCEEARSEGTHLWGLLQEVRALSEDVFHEDAVDQIRENSENKYAWKLAILGRRAKTENSSSGEEEEQEEGAREEEPKLLGFMIYNLFQLDRKLSLSVLRVAVPDRLRGVGCGKRLMQFAVKIAKSMREAGSGAVVCSSLAESVPFYKRLGFTVDNAAYLKELTPAEGLIPGQIWMKYKLPKLRAPVKKKK